MLQREEIRKGLRVRLVANSLDVPAGTSATVDEVGVVSGVWRFTVQYDTYQPITPPNTDTRRTGPIRSHSMSLRQWESDLAMFERIDESVIETRPAPARQPKIPKRPVGWRKRELKRLPIHTNQLSLFSADDF